MSNISFWHRVKLPDGTYTPGDVHHGPDGGDWPTTRFGLPKDLSGKEVIDIGAWDGFFSFESEKRNARFIIATNPKPPKGPSLDGFYSIHRALESKVRYMDLDIENEKDIHLLISFDVVLFYGVLYHLKNPLIAMENVAKLTKTDGICLLETAMTITDLKSSNTPALEYGPNTHNDATNHFYPNEAWIKLSAITVGFSKCELIYLVDNRATFRLTK